MTFGKPGGNPAWVKGTSANPAGRPRSAHISELAKKYTPAAIHALAEALTDKKTKVAAATALLDRAWGKPAQSVAVTTGDGMQLHLLAAIAASEELQHILEQRKTQKLSAPVIDADVDEPAPE